MEFRHRCIRGSPGFQEIFHHGRVGRDLKSQCTLYGHLYVVSFILRFGGNNPEVWNSKRQFHSTGQVDEIYFGLEGRTAFVGQTYDRGQDGHILRLNNVIIGACYDVVFALVLIKEYGCLSRTYPKAAPVTDAVFSMRQSCLSAGIRPPFPDEKIFLITADHIHDAAFFFAEKSHYFLRAR